MLSLIITVIGLSCLAVSIVVTALYPFAKSKRRTAYRALLESEGEGIKPAREEYLRLDRRARRLSLIGLACYAVGLFSIIPLGHAENHYQLTAVLGLTLSMWVLMAFVTFGQDDWQIRITVEDEKRRRQLDALRRQATKGDSK